MKTTTIVYYYTTKEKSEQTLSAKVNAEVSPQWYHTVYTFSKEKNTKLYEYIPVYGC